MRAGAICYLDEIVEARKDTTVVIHPLADERRELPIEKRGEVLRAPPGLQRPGAEGQSAGGSGGDCGSISTMFLSVS